MSSTAGGLEGTTQGGAGQLTGHGGVGEEGEGARGREREDDDQAEQGVQQRVEVRVLAEGAGGHTSATGGGGGGRERHVSRRAADGGQRFCLL